MSAAMSSVTAQPGSRQVVKVLFVGGMPRSGSTLTDLLLHQLPGHVGVGELFYLWRNGVEHNGLCACGEPFLDCPFWTSVGAQAFGGWTIELAHKMQRLQDKVDKTARLPWLLASRRPRAFDQALDEYLSMLTRLYSAVASVSVARVVVDSSKRPSLAYALRRSKDLDVRVVHVVRDPRGVAFSFAKHVQLPAGAALKTEMPRSSTRKVSRRWVTVNGLIGALGRLGVPTVTIRYEDLVAKPVETLRRVLELEGEPAPAESLAFVDGSSFIIPRTHLIAAGRIRLASGEMALRLDEDWRAQMPRPSRRLVDVMTVPLRWRYGYR